jgi:hypothetical protein
MGVSRWRAEDRAKPAVAQQVSRLDIADGRGKLRP